MTMFIYPIVQILEALRQWCTSGSNKLANSLVDDEEMANVHDHRNTATWYLLPPC